MPQTEPTLKATDLTIGYCNGRQQTVVASGLNLELHKSTVTCLLGANGTGKSTLLRTLARQQPALSGHITINGRDLASARLQQVARMMSVVYTERTNAGALTAYETVSLGRQPYTGFFGRLDNADRQIVSDSLAAVGILSLANRYMATLSDGERQKVMIARALAQQSPVMILDEPTTFLDVASRLEVMALLSRLAKEFETAVLLSTHDIADALSIAGQLWLMKPNKTITCGITTELIDAGEMDELFPGRNVCFDSSAGDYRIKQKDCHPE